MDAKRDDSNEASFCERILPLNQLSLDSDATLKHFFHWHILHRRWGGEKVWPM